jgi:predicted dehydrogenase
VDLDLPSVSKFFPMTSPDLLRIGILGAARIAPVALVSPARHVAEVEVSAVAARDRAKSETFAKKHGIPRVLDDYDSVLSDSDIDAVYIPLPNGLHFEWMRKAIEAGKHVLCEKPFTSNAAEAETIASLAAERPDQVVMEAFHWRYHPLAARMLEIIESGELGGIRRIETSMCIPLPLPNDIRYRYDLAGGATMDTGCYAIHMLRTLAGEEGRVVGARFGTSSPNVDRWMSAEFEFASGKTGRMNCSLMSSTLLRVSAVVEGREGRLRVFNPVAPQIYHRLRVETRAGVRKEKVPGESTYTRQLRSFAAAALRGEPTLTPPQESVANMRAIDAVYDTAGLPRRGRKTG